MKKMDERVDPRAEDVRVLLKVPFAVEARQRPLQRATARGDKLIEGRVG